MKTLRFARTESWLRRTCDPSDRATRELLVRAVLDVYVWFPDGFGSVGTEYHKEKRLQPLEAEFLIKHEENFDIDVLYVAVTHDSVMLLLEAAANGQRTVRNDEPALVCNALVREAVENDGI